MKRIIAIVLACLMLFALCACGGGSRTSGTGKAPGADTASAEDTGVNINEAAVVEAEEEDVDEKKTEDGWLVIGVTTSSAGFDPTVDLNYYGIPLVYDSLFTYDTDGNVQGLLAESWEWTDDTHLTIHMVEDATFSDGNPVTAEDALYSMSRYSEKGSRWSTYLSAIDFENSEAVDDYTLVLAFSGATGPALHYLATRHSSVLEKSYVESMDDDGLWQDFPCSGAYICTENVSGASATFQRRDDYWGAKPEAEFIKIIFYTENTTMMIDYENGAIDMAINIADKDVARVQAGDVEHTNLVISGYYNQFEISFPEYTELFDDIRVREAFAYAIDADAIAEAAFGSLFSSATSTLPADIRFHTDIGKYEYDPQRAIELLEEAGYSAGDINLRMVVISFPQHIALAEALQAYLEAVGVNLSIESYAQPVAVSYFQTGDTDLVLNNNAEGALSADPDQWYDTWKSTSTNATMRRSDETFNEYLAAGAASMDDDERAEAYKEAQQWLYDNYCVIPICDGLQAYIYKDYISSAECLTPVAFSFRDIEFAK